MDIVIHVALRIPYKTLSVRLGVRVPQFGKQCSRGVSKYFPVTRYNNTLLSFLCFIIISVFFFTFTYCILTCVIDAEIRGTFILAIGIVYFKKILKY